MAEAAESILPQYNATSEERADHAALFAQLISGSRWALAGRCGAVAALMLMNALLTRILGPEEVGAFFLIFSVVVAAATLSQLGLPVAIVNLVGDAVGRHRWGRARTAIRATLWTASGAIAASSLLMLAVGPALTRHIFHSAMVSAAMTIAAAWLAVRGIQTLLAEVFRGLKDYSQRDHSLRTPQHHRFRAGVCRNLEHLRACLACRGAMGVDCSGYVEHHPVGRHPPLPARAA